MDIKKEIANHWDKNVCGLDRAPNYEMIDALRFKEYPYLERILNLPTFFDKRVLEIGVGVGIDACRIIRFGEPKSYTLFDISPNTLAECKKHLDLHCKKRNYNFINGDMENMSTFQGESFERIIAIGSIHHTPNPEQALKEISRVLTFDGSFIFMFYCKDSLRYRIKFRLFSQYYRVKAKLYPRFDFRLKLSPDEYVRILDGDDNPLGKAFTKKEIKRFCENARLKIMKMSQFDEGFVLYVTGTKTKQT